MFKIIYAIGFSLVALTLVVGIVLCAIATVRDAPENDIVYYFDLVFIVFFYLLGIPAGIPFLILNMARLIIDREPLYIILTIVSVGWVGFSVFLWLSHGFVI
jgi:hypothetical protein